jgi:hypothetical protein
MKVLDKKELIGKMRERMSLLIEIERAYRTDLMFNLRKAINERFYGFR